MKLPPATPAISFGSLSRSPWLQTDGAGKPTPFLSQTSILFLQSLAAASPPWSYQGIWNTGVTYGTGSVVSYQGSLWLSPVNGNSGNAPASGAWWMLTDWAQLGALAAWGSLIWGQTAAYQTDSVVVYSGQLWISLQSANVGNTPQTGSEWWTPIPTEENTELGALAAISVFTIGSLVRFPPYRPPAVVVPAALYAAEIGAAGETNLADGTWTDVDGCILTLGGPGTYLLMANCCLELEAADGNALVQLVWAPGPAYTDWTPLAGQMLAAAIPLTVGAGDLMCSYQWLYVTANTGDQVKIQGECSGSTGLSNIVETGTNLLAIQIA